VAARGEGGGSGYAASAAARGGGGCAAPCCSQWCQLAFLKKNGANQDEPRALLELIKVTFVGFMASIPSISNGSVDRCTECFIHLAAAAIVSGLMWRLLTHLKSADDMPKIVVNLASILIHFFIVIAVIPFAIMAGKALLAS
jgi:hypothetical protein